MKGNEQNIEQWKKTGKLDTRWINNKLIVDAEEIWRDVLLVVVDDLKTDDYDSIAIKRTTMIKVVHMSGNWIVVDQVPTSFEHTHLLYYPAHRKHLEKYYSGKKITKKFPPGELKAGWSKDWVIVQMESDGLFYENGVQIGWRICEVNGKNNFLHKDRCRFILKEDAEKFGCTVSFEVGKRPPVLDDIYSSTKPLHYIHLVSRQIMPWGVAFNKDWQVVRMEPGGAFYTAGVKVSERIYTINGELFRKPNGFSEKLIAKIKQGEPCTIGFDEPKKKMCLQEVVQFDIKELLEYIYDRISQENNRFDRICLILESNATHNWGVALSGKSNLQISKLSSSGQFKKLGVEVMWAILSINGDTDREQILAHMRRMKRCVILFQKPLERRITLPRRMTKDWGAKFSNGRIVSLSTKGDLHQHGAEEGWMLKKIIDGNGEVLPDMAAYDLLCPEERDFDEMVTLSFLDSNRGFLEDMYDRISEEIRPGQVCLIVESNTSHAWGVVFAGKDHFQISKLSRKGQFKKLGVDLMWAIVSINGDMEKKKIFDHLKRQERCVIVFQKPLERIITIPRRMTHDWGAEFRDGRIVALSADGDFREHGVEEGWMLKKITDGSGNVVRDMAAYDSIQPSDKNMEEMVTLSFLDNNKVEV